MKQILSTALAIVLFVGAAQAQRTEKGDRRPKGDRSEMAINHLNLTAEQKAKFESLREAQRKELKGLKNSDKATPEQRKAIHEKYKTQYQSLLTPAQQEELKNKKETWKENGNRGKRGMNKKGGDLGRQAAFFKKELDLTSDQEAKLKNMLQEFRSKSQDIRTNSSLSNEQKRTQVQALAEQFMTQGKAVLTPEQQEKLDDRKGKRKGKKGANV